jgi:hypothetical protein
VIGIIAATLFALAPVVSPDSDLPDPTLTPGAANPALTVSKVCAATFSTKKLRHVTKGRSEEVYREYGYDKEQKPCPCTLDHLVPLEIGGASTIKNLWPQLVAEAEVKDWLEDRLHDLICEGKVTQEQAQHDIATDWISAYEKYMPK